MVRIVVCTRSTTERAENLDKGSFRSRCEVEQAQLDRTKRTVHSRRPNDHRRSWDRLSSARFWMHNGCLQGQITDPELAVIAFRGNRFTFRLGLPMM